MIRLLFLVHRYLGIAIGVLMVMWCMSGVVMMYVSYPQLGEGTRLEALAQIQWDGCCKIDARALADTDAVGDFIIETLNGRPVLQLRRPGQPRLIDLISGLPIESVSPEEATTVASGFIKDAEHAPARLQAKIDYDQWTVSGEFAADRPLYRFGLNDGSGTEIYVSSTTGHAVQMTTARERFWNWLGAVPHWLYFKELRRRPALWTQVVIVTSMIGCFLAATGIYIGVRQLISQPTGRWSPYRGFNLWHHLAGLAFGVFALSWLLSGLLSMNPYGWLEGAGAQEERAKLRGDAVPTGKQLRTALQIFANAQPASLVSLASAPLGGRLYLIANRASGEPSRLDANALPAALTDTDLAYVARALGGNGSAALPSLMTQEDAYYFSHHHEFARLPVYRMITPDSAGTRYYIDAISGTLVAKIDSRARAYRWWHQALHRMDFAAPLRARPQWDALMLLLMSGVTVLCVSGAYLGLRRLLGRQPTVLPAAP
jgi:uncharacterized iron-regulated membrane protein